MPLLPTLNTGPEVMVIDTSSRSATLPTSPFKNKYEAPHLTQCDSPIGLYNIPKQRTSQAFSSLDDIDAMNSASTTMRGAAHPGGPLPPPKTGYNQGQPRNNVFPGSGGGNSYPSLERSTMRSNGGKTNHLANRELPALPSSSSSLSSNSLKSRVEAARSMEDLDVLEASGIRGHSKMNYREVNGQMDSASLMGDNVSMLAQKLSF